MNLEQWMNDRGMRDHELAAQVPGLSRSQVSRIRRRISIPSPETAKKLSDLTGLPAEALIYVERVRAA
jgi:transcriptional regulator with XRE-family HTH domain